MSALKNDLEAPYRRDLIWAHSRIPAGESYYIDENNWRNTLHGVECVDGVKRSIGSSHQEVERPKASAGSAEIWRQANARLCLNRVMRPSGK